MTAMDMHAFGAQTLRATLDRFNVGVAIVGGDGRIVHANDAARAMFQDGAHIRNYNGRLGAASRAATDDLLRAIRNALGSTPAAGTGGIGLALPGSDGRLATAHVVPLARGVDEEGAAAVFVARANVDAQPDLTAIAQSYRLTPAELRLLGRLLLGETVVGAAASLRIKESTARTHLQSLLAKTGAARQTQLIALVHRLLPPVTCRAA